MKRFFDKSGPTTQVFHTEDDEHYISSHIADVEPLLDANARHRNYGPRETMLGRKLGSVDPVTYMEWLRQDGINVAHFMRWPRKEKAAYLRRKLGDLDYMKFRTVDKL